MPATARQRRTRRRRRRSRPAGDSRQRTRFRGPQLRKLADNDGFETGAYEGFDGFFGGLQTKLSRDEVREEIRRSVRRRMEDEGKVWMSDLQTDKVLQRSLVEILDRLGK